MMTLAAAPPPRARRAVLDCALAGPVLLLTAPPAGAAPSDPGPWMAAGTMTLNDLASLLAAFAVAGLAAGGAALFSARARRRERAAARALAAARADVAAFQALLAGDAPMALLWAPDRPTPHAFGIASPHAERGDLAAVLGPAGAAALAAPILALRAEGVPFVSEVDGPDGRRLKVEGRACAGACAVLIRPLGPESGRAAAQEAVGLRARGEAECLRAKLEAEGHRAKLEAEGLRAMVEAAPAAAWLRRPDGALSYVNPAYAAAVGAASPGDARTTELLDGPVRAAAAAAHGAGLTFRDRVRAVVGGSRRLLEVVEAAGPFGAAGLAMDVTGEESARAETTRTVAAHRRTLDQLSTAVVIFGPDERLLFHNAAYERLFDLDPAFLDQRPTESEVLENLRNRRMVPEQADYRAWRQHLREAYRALEPVNDWWHLPGGQMLHVVATPNAEGGVTYLFDDLSERMALESRYNSLIRIQGETLDGLAEAVAVFGSDGRLRLYNQAFLTLWSLSAQALGDKPHIDAVAAMCRPLHGETGAFSRIRSVVTAIEQREPAKLRLERADGRVLDGTAQPLPDGGTMVTFRDVTDSVQVERALIERNEALEASAVLKNAFVGHVSYHLRTPLNTVIGYAHMLGEDVVGPLNPRQREFLSHVSQSADALRLLIDDILDLATIDAGAMALDLGEVDVRGTLDAVAEAVRDQLDAGGVRLAVAAQTDAGRFVADGRRVRQILFNLVSNAIAVSPAGGTVTLGAERTADAVVITVRDEGPGVPEEIADKVFERFETASVGARHRGAGLGLSIVRSFMELHHGTVSVRPAPGGGTIATCIFPLSGEDGAREAAE